ncbi:MAG: GLUG motif-containing protein [Ignavibacteria bacterium]|jgi:hypothetical protein
MKKLVLFVILLIVCQNLLSAQYSGGQGIATDPYKIATTEDLIELSNTWGDWDKYFIQTADISFDADETQVDWDGSGSVGGDDERGFYPIGNSTVNFTGSYDGENHKIDNLYINRSSRYGVGLLGLINNAIISNLGVTNVDITGKDNVGGLVGYNSAITNATYSTVSSPISNCFSTGSVSGFGNYVGGLVGYNSATTNTVYSSSSSPISNCYSTGSVSGSDYVGGLVGYNSSSASYYSSSSSISNCYSTGSVSGSGNNVGGLVGYNSSEYSNRSSISNCYSTGDVARSSGSDTAFGGFCGWNYNSAIECCYSVGNVIYEDAANPIDKGFLGYGSGTFTSNFFDSTASNQSTDGPGAATPKTTSEMKTQSTFTDWDFTDVWQIVGGDGANYPTLREIDIVTGVEDNNLSLELPLEFTLEQNYPNPFNPSTVINYHLSEHSKVELKVYDILSREIAVLVNKEQAAGNYTVNFNASSLSSGVYFYQIKTGKYLETRKMLLLR